jgi:hypothetical protein
MIDTIVTHIPFHRFGDVQNYFVKNADETRASRKIVYVDDVFTNKQVEFLKNEIGSLVEVRPGKWRDKNLTILQIFKDLKTENSNALFIDSDNVLDPGFRELDSNIGEDFYTVFEHGKKSMDTLDRKRVKPLRQVTAGGKRVEVSTYNVVGGIWKGIFYLGPKQAIRIGKKTLAIIDSALLKELQGSVEKLPYGIGNQLSDEATLGILFYYSGIKQTPWVEFTTHVQADLSGRGRYSKVLKSLANAQLARGMFSSKRPRVYWYYTRYKLTEIVSSI